MIGLLARYRRAIALAVIGLLMLILWQTLFVQPYGLDRFGGRPRQSIGTISQFSSEAAYRYIGGMAALFILYGAGLTLLARRRAAENARGLLPIVIVIALACSAVLLLLYPLDAADIYDYIVRGRMAAVYDLNPLRDLPTRIPDDIAYRFAAWRRVPSAYGPLWEIIAQATSAVTADLSLNIQVIAYKLIAVAGYAVTGLCIGLTLRRIAPERALLGLTLFLWNPLVLYMTAGTGHNDAVMTACIALALYCCARRWFVLAILGALLGVTVKFIPALLLPFIALAAWRALGARRALRAGVIAAVLGGALVVVLYAPYWHGWETIRAERRAFMFTGSVATVARHWLMPILDGEADLTTPPRQTPVSSGLLANGTLILFTAIALIELARLWRTPDPPALFAAVARVIFAYLLIASIWFHAWYVLWLIAVIALLADTPTRRLALWFSYLVTWQTLLYNHFTWETRSGVWLPWLDLIPVTLYMGVTYALIARLHWTRLAGAWRARRHSAA